MTTEKLDVIHQLKEKYFEAKVVVESETSFLADLKKRISATAVRLNSMGRELEEMTQVRNVILKQISRNEADESDLKTQTIKIDDLKLSQRNVGDLLAVLKTTESETQLKVTKLGAAFQGAGHELWFRVSEYEASKLKEVEGPLLRSWGAFCMSGAPPNLAPFLQSHFANFPWDTSKVEADLRREYLTTKGGK